MGGNLDEIMRVGLHDGISVLIRRDTSELACHVNSQEDGGHLQAKTNEINFAGTMVLDF